MRLLILIAGSVLLLLGAISMVTPIPGGTLAITVGAGLLICASERVTNFIRGRREKFARFNRMVTWLEEKMGPKLSRPLRMTRPGEEQIDGLTCGSDSSIDAPPVEKNE